MILVFGIIGWMSCLPLSIAAWVMGNNDLRAMDAGRMDPDGRGLTQAGRILGMVACILLILTLFAVAAMMVLGVGIGAVSHSSY